MLEIQLERIDNTVSGMSVSRAQQDRIEKMRSDIKDVIQQHKEKIKTIDKKEEKPTEEEADKEEKSTEEKAGKGKTPTKKNIVKPPLLDLPRIESLPMEAKEGTKFPGKKVLAKKIRRNR